MFKKIESDIVRSRESEEKFLIHVYDQMFATINRIHNNIWEMVVAVGGGIGVLKLYLDYGYNSIFEFGVLGYVITLSWFLTRLIDFCYWYNRNLFIIQNIENKFLGPSAEDIYAGFRPQNLKKTLEVRTTISIQICFLVTIQFSVLIFYLFCNPAIQYIRVHIEIVPAIFVFALLLIISFVPATYVFYLRNIKYKNKIKQKQHNKIRISIK